MDVRQEFAAKRCSADDALRLVRDGDTVVVPTGVGEPPLLLAALSARRREFHDVRVSQILPLRKFDYFDLETVDHVRHVAYFFGSASRAGGQAGWIDYVPAYFSELPEMIRRGQTPADVVFAIASSMDAHGYFALSLGADYTMAAVEKARAVVLETNPNVPFAHGACHVHVSRIAAVVESDAPMIEVGLPAIGPVQQAIGAFVAEMIPDGATLQIGYGGIPDAVVMQLTAKRDLGVHTEMVGDAVMGLVEAGVVTNRRKNYLPGKTIATFALGGRRLYDYMDRNPSLEMHPVDFTNDPFLASRNDHLIAINATMQVDLIGQCGSESLGFTPWSGTGGQSDFVRAANRSAGGKAVIVLPSTAMGGKVSRIVHHLSAGTHVTTSKNDVNYVVTEFGVAQLRGKSAKRRAEALIAIAHPDFQPQLREEARRMRLV